MPTNIPKLRACVIVACETENTYVQSIFHARARAHKRTHTHTCASKAGGAHTAMHYERYLQNSVHFVGPRFVTSKKQRRGQGMGESHFGTIPYTVTDATEYTQVAVRVITQRGQGGTTRHGKVYRKTPPNSSSFLVRG
jgi:hypothetical protein